MRLFRKCAQEDVNYECLKADKISTSAHFIRKRFSVPDADYSDQNSSKISYIKNSSQKQNVNIEAQARKSFNDISENEINKQAEINYKNGSTAAQLSILPPLFLLSSPPSMSAPPPPQQLPPLLSFVSKSSSISMSSDINDDTELLQQSKLVIQTTKSKAQGKPATSANESKSKNQSEIIVTIKQSKKLIKVLKLLINFIYFIILKPLLFGYEDIQFLDRSFIDKKTCVNNNNKDIIIIHNNNSIINKRITNNKKCTNNDKYDNGKQLGKRYNDFTINLDIYNEYKNYDNNNKNTKNIINNKKPVYHKRKRVEVSRKKFSICIQKILSSLLSSVRKLNKYQHSKLKNLLSSVNTFVKQNFKIKKNIYKLLSLSQSSSVQKNYVLSKFSSICKIKLKYSNNKNVKYNWSNILQKLSNQTKIEYYARIINKTCHTNNNNDNNKNIPNNGGGGGNECKSINANDPNNYKKLLKNFAININRLFARKKLIYYNYNFYNYYYHYYNHDSKKNNNTKTRYNSNKIIFFPFSLTKYNFCDKFIKFLTIKINKIRRLFIIFNIKNSMELLNGIDNNQILTKDFLITYVKSVFYRLLCQLFQIHYKFKYQIIFMLIKLTKFKQQQQSILSVANRNIFNRTSKKNSSIKNLVITDGNNYVKCTNIIIINFFRYFVHKLCNICVYIDGNFIKHKTIINEYKTINTNINKNNNNNNDCNGNSESCQRNSVNSGIIQLHDRSPSPTNQIQKKHHPFCCPYNHHKHHHNSLRKQQQQSEQHSLLHYRRKYVNDKLCCLRSLLSLRAIKSIFIIALIACVPDISASFHHNIKYSTNIVKTKYGPLRGIIVRSNPSVEAFLGVPYASAPVGSLRYMPPVTPSTWRTTRLADRFSAVCPQVAAVPPNGPEALLEVPRGRLAQLRRLRPLLANQSEDCLYLNLYVPRTSYPAPSFGTGFANDASAPGPNSSGDSGSSGGNGGDSGEKPLAAIVYIHGESYEWNSGNPYDGSVLAAHGNVIVVTINFRLGVLGFLKTGGKGSAQGNYGLMDLVAGLHWLRENLPAFGGDPNRVTIMGHGTGAALANVLIVSPVASDLVHRAILLSGSALSPWAIQKDPLFVKRRVAEQTGCHGDLLEDDLAPCLRTKPISELLAVKIDSPRFLPGFAPFIDGTVIAHPSGGAAGPLTLPAGSAIASTYGIELADFPTRELIFGLTTVESYLDLSAQDLEFGFNETRRDRILRTYVRNVYHYHLNEIYSALKNEYTDWERPGRSPMGSRDAALELLSDGHTAAPLVRLGYLHSLRGGRSYFLHFRHQSGERDYPQRGGSVRGEDVPFCLGLPISPLFPHNYTKQDIKISRILIRYISNFAQTGNPNETPTSVDISHIVHSKSAIVASALTSSMSLPPSQSSSSSLSMSPLSGAEGGILETGLPSSSSLIAPPPQPPLKISGAVSSSSAALAGIPSASLSSSLSIVKHVNDQYLSQLSSSSLNVAAVVAAAEPASSSLTSSSAGSGPAEQSSVSLLASSGGDSTAFLVEDDSVTKPKSKRHAISTGRRKRKTSKRTPAAGRKHSDNPSEMSGVGGISNAGGNSNIGGRGGGIKKLHRKKYPSKPSESSMEESSSSIAADQESIGGDGAAEGTGNRITGHIGASGGDEIEEEETEIDEGEEDDEDDEDEDEPIPDEDEFDERTDDEGDEKDSSARNKNSHHLDDDDVEKFDRFDDVSITRLPFWDTYDAINQLYLELGTKIEIKNHYRGHKLSMWLSLIPQLHSPGDLSELPMRHHHFLEDSTQYYDGIIRPQIMQRPTFPKVSVHLPIGPLTSPPVTTTASTPKADLTAGLNAGVPATTTECPPNTTIVPTIAATRPQNHQQNGSVSGSKQDTSNNLLRRLANSQYQSYTTALTVTIAVGCFLLLLNVLIFAGIYYQREKRANDAKKKEELQEAETRCSASPNLEKLGAGSGMCGGPGVGGSGIGGGGKNSRKSSLQSLTGFNSSGSFGEYSCYDEKIQCKEKHALADICSVELPLKEFKCSSISSPAPSNTGSLRRSTNTSNPGSLLMYPPSYHQQQQHHNPHKHHHYASEQQGCSNNGLVTYQQFQKSGQPTSANVGTSTEQCNQSTQSEQPSVQDVGTSVDEKAVAGSGTVKLKGDNGCGNDDDDDMISPGIPEPPPPPKSSAPYQGGILRQPGPPTTPGSNKKRVQIQEISV